MDLRHFCRPVLPGDKLELIDMTDARYRAYVNTKGLVVTSGYEPLDSDGLASFGLTIYSLIRPSQTIAYAPGGTVMLRSTAETRGVMVDVQGVEWLWARLPDATNDSDIIRLDRLDGENGNWRVFKSTAPSMPVMTYGSAVNHIALALEDGRVTMTEVGKPRLDNHSWLQLSRGLRDLSVVSGSLAIQGS